MTDLQQKNNAAGIHSPKVRKILNTPPSFLTRWGITIISIILLLLAIAYIMYYTPA